MHSPWVMSKSRSSPSYSAPNINVPGKFKSTVIIIVVVVLVVVAIVVVVVVIGAVICLHAAPQVQLLQLIC